MPALYLRSQIADIVIIPHTTTKKTLRECRKVYFTRFRRGARQNYSTAAHTCRKGVWGMSALLFTIALCNLYVCIMRHIFAFSEKDCTVLLCAGRTPSCRRCRRRGGGFTVPPPLSSLPFQISPPHRNYSTLRWYCTGVAAKRE